MNYRLNFSKKLLIASSLVAMAVTLPDILVKGAGNQSIAAEVELATSSDPLEVGASLIQIVRRYAIKKYILADGTFDAAYQYLDDLGYAYQLLDYPEILLINEEELKPPAFNFLTLAGIPSSEVINNVLYKLEEDTNLDVSFSGEYQGAALFELKNERLTFYASVVKMWPPGTLLILWSKNPQEAFDTEPKM